MKRNIGVFSTDQVTLDGLQISAAALMNAYQREVENSISRESPQGMPSYMQHDMHRLVGWSTQFGLYIDAAMVRVLGQIIEPVLDEEKILINKLAESYWLEHNSHEAAPYADELLSRLSPANIETGQLIAIEAVVLSRIGLASELYPELFTPNTALVDKDGLVNYRDLLTRMKEIQPGVFHEPERNVLLFAHRFFRRSLSHRNKLNSYFLSRLAKSMINNTNLRVKVKLDPDIVGHPDSARELIEMEYWRGPKYNDDIANIPSGVAEHKADERTRYFHGIDCTHIWWKNPEVRSENDDKFNYRTFEIEELIENESWGIGPDRFGCRYAHAEYSVNSSVITHFDGAIRAYAANDYFRRIDTSIDKAGKNSDYTKVFRLDGDIQVSDWKQLLTDFFKGNSLIPEYLGAPAEIEEFAPSTPPHVDDYLNSEDPKLVALISLFKGSIKPSLSLHSELNLKVGDESIEYIEIGNGEVKSCLCSKLNLENVTTVGFGDDVLNLSRLCFGSTDEPNEFFRREIRDVSSAISKDFDSGQISRVSIPLTWQMNEQLLISLTLAGDAKIVANALFRLPDIIDLTDEPSIYIEALSNLIKEMAPQTKSSIIWDGVDYGTLSIKRSGTVNFCIRLPKKLQKDLISTGNLKISNGSR